MADPLRAPAVSACPACDVAGPALARGARGGFAAKIVLSVPSAHCAACIAGIEGALQDLPGVRAARVNLTQRRALVDAVEEVRADAMIAALARAGYEAHELDAETAGQGGIDRAGRDLLMRIGVAGFAMMNVMILSVAIWSGADPATRSLFHWISAAVTLPVVLFAGRPFFAGALAALRARRAGMDLPIALAIVIATGLSLSETWAGGPRAWFEAALMLTFFLLVGRYLDHRSRSAARSAVAELAALEVPVVTVLRPGGAQESVALRALGPGDLVRVLPGARFPADGTIETGLTEIDRSLVTGESAPAAAGPGMRIAAGEGNLTGAVVLRVTAVGAQSTLGRIAALVTAAEAARSQRTERAQRAARIYVPLVHLVAGGTFAGWLWATGDLRLALNVAVSVLIITCPCALGLAVPAVVAAASGHLFRRGLLLKDGAALERLAEVDVALLDKTGTLTEGQADPADLEALAAPAARIALALAQGSAHPLSRALEAALNARKVVPARLDDLREVPGEGVAGRCQGVPVRLGRRAGEPQGGTVSWLTIGDAAPIALRFAERLRPGAAELVAGLRAQKVAVRIVSGDQEAAVAALAVRLGIADWQAETGPEAKARLVAELSARGHRVLMLGDGLNDTAALAAAHVSISPASALDAARAAADIVFLGSDISRIGEAVGLSRRVVARIRENFALAALYNLIAVPVAICGLATPLLAAIAMSGSSLSVTLNAFRLRGHRKGAAG